MRLRSLTRQTVGILALLVVSSAPPRLAAATPENADDGCLSDAVCRGHYEQAVAQFEQGHFDAALPEFQAAYQQRQMPWLLINLGRTLHRLGRPQEALEKYQRYTQAEPRMDAQTRKRLDKYIAQAQAQSQTQIDNPQAPFPGSAALKPAEVAPPPAAGPPLYKKWWFWTAIGGGAAAIVGVGIGIGVASRPPSSLPSDVMVYRPGF